MFFRDSANRVHFEDDNGQHYHYFTEIFYKTFNEYIDYDRFVGYPIVDSGDFLYGTEFWLFKRPGKYVLELDLLYKTDEKSGNRLFQFIFDETIKTFYETDLLGFRGCREKWEFVIEKPNTRASFYNVRPKTVRV